MQPNKGLCSRDSCSTYQPESIYDYVQNPRRKTQTLKENVKVDTIQSEQEILSRLLNSKNRGKIVVFIKAGKLFFRVLYFPFRLVITKIPKYLIYKIYPKLQFRFQLLVSKFQNGFQQFYKEITLRAKVLKSIVNVLKPLAQVMKSSLNHMLSHGFKSTSKWISNSMNYLMVPFKIFAKASKRAMKLAKFSQLTIPRFSLPIQQRFVFAKPIGFSLKLKNLSKSLAHSFKNGLERSQNRMKELSNQLKYPLTKGIKFFQKIIQDPLKNAEKTITHLKNKIKEVVLPKIESLVLPVHKMATMTLSLIQVPVNLFLQSNLKIVRLFSKNRSFSKMKEKFQNFKQFASKLGFYQKNILKSFERLVHDFSSQSRKWVDFFLSQLNKLLVVVKKLLLKGVSYVYQTFRWIFRSLRVIFRLLMLKLRNLFNFIVLIFKWILILFKFSLFLMKEVYLEIKNEN